MALVVIVIDAVKVCDAVNNWDADNVIEPVEVRECDTLGVDVEVDDND